MTTSYIKPYSALHMDPENENDISVEYNDLEYIDLPPLSPTCYLEPLLSSRHTELSPLPDDNYNFDICMDKNNKMKENSLLMNEVEDNDYMCKDKLDSSVEETETKREIKDEFYYSCCKCNKTVQMRDMFSLDYKNPSSLNRLICLSCSVDSEENYMLHDWNIIIECDKKRYCPRCRKDKPIYKFKESNKYCDYCLLRKKWLRLKNKCHKNDEYVENGYNSSNSSDDSDKIEVRKVKCCNCNKLINIQHAFLYSKVKDSLSSRFICLNCSLDVRNNHLLRDWEDKVDHDCGRLCSRCKKVKSFSRFRLGHLACEYCCLKRKRLYLLTRK